VYLELLEKVVGGIGKCLCIFSKLIMIVGASSVGGGILNLQDGYSRVEWLPMVLVGLITILIGYLLRAIAKSWFFRPLVKKSDIRMTVEGKEWTG
jgi:glucose uptake protein GlcU